MGWGAESFSHAEGGGGGGGLEALAILKAGRGGGAKSFHSLKGGREKLRGGGEHNVLDPGLSHFVAPLQSLN